MKLVARITVVGIAASALAMAFACSSSSDDGTDSSSGGGTSGSVGSSGAFAR